MDILQYWYMLPISIIIATVAMAAGIEGATFFTPLFLLLLNLPIEIAITAGLITQLFGFASGLHSYHKRGLIDYKLGRSLLIVTIPLALLGTFVSGFVESYILKSILAVGLVIIGLTFLRAQNSSMAQPKSEAINSTSSEKTTKNSCKPFLGRFLTGLGALFTGMVSTGLGQLNSFYMLRVCQMPSSRAVATSVFIIAVTTLVASGGHLTKLLQAESDSMKTVTELVIFAAPGVFLGGQLGPMISAKISQRSLELALGVLFLLVALVLGVEALG